MLNKGDGRRKTNMGSYLSTKIDCDLDYLVEQSDKAWKHLLATVHARNEVYYSCALEDVLTEHPEMNWDDETSWIKEAYEKQETSRQQTIENITAGLDKLEAPALSMVEWVVDKCVEHEKTAKIADPNRKERDPAAT
jgi:hypothetical protein